MLWITSWWLRNPNHQLMVNIPLFVGFQPSKVQDFEPIRCMCEFVGFAWLCMCIPTRYGIYMNEYARIYYIFYAYLCINYRCVLYTWVRECRDAQPCLIYFRNCEEYDFTDCGLLYSKDETVTGGHWGEPKQVLQISLLPVQVSTGKMRIPIQKRTGGCPRDKATGIPIAVPWPDKVAHSTGALDTFLHGECCFQCATVEVRSTWLLCGDYNIL